jgi:hypothetical protein
MAAISRCRIAPEIEWNLLLCIPIIPQKDKSVRGSFSQFIVRKPKFKMAAVSRYPEVRSHQKSKGTFSSSSPLLPKILNQFMKFFSSYRPETKFKMAPRPISGY